MDRQNLVQNAAPIAGTTPDLESGQGNITSNQPPQQQSIFQLSSHPTALLFLFLFRGLALIVYITSSIWFPSKFVFPFVVIVLLLSFDFWTVKNVTGRLLVGLRWWNEIREDGSNVWVFESKENRVVNATDSRVFWTVLYVTPVIWGLLAFIALLKFNLGWFLVTIVSIVMNVANLIGYTRCEKDAKAKLTSFIAGQGMVQGMVGNFITNRIGSFFSGGGGAPAPAGRV
ncbi:Golgi apparatus membrane protein TVP23 A [Rhizophlyctis rosea]|nr:Golgi apparatus membrane protein TVP23 A [Rhizophlyctis rosea]